MSEPLTPADFLAGASVDAAVFALRPDYRAMLLAVDGLVPGPSDDATEELLQAAETAAREAVADQPLEQLPTWLPGARRTGPSAPNRSARATVSRP